MPSAEDFINDTLAHYASEYYDPAKAREYYLRTRELKGRRSGSALKTEDKKEAWNYAQTQINEAEKTAYEANNAERQRAIEAARTKAADLREKLIQSLRNFLENISVTAQTETKTLAEGRAKRLEEIFTERKQRLEKAAKKRAEEKEKIAAGVAKDLAALPPIPKGISSAQRARLVDQRNKKIDHIRGRGQNQNAVVDKRFQAEKEEVAAWTNAERANVAKYTQAARENISETARINRADGRVEVEGAREEIRKELQTSIDGAKAAWETLKVAVKAKYEQARDTEFESIRQNV